MRFTVAITQEGNMYVARCLEVEVTSQGQTVEDALINLREALKLYFEDVSPKEIPLSPIIAPLDIEVNSL